MRSIKIKHALAGRASQLFAIIQITRIADDLHIFRTIFDVIDGKLVFRREIELGQFDVDLTQFVLGPLT